MTYCAWFDALDGQPLRYLLCLHLIKVGRPQTVRQLIDAVEARGFTIAGRANKTVSDKLRTEVRRGRVIRVGRGLYAAGQTPRSTRWWMQKRLSELVDHSTVCRAEIVAKRLAR